MVEVLDNDSQKWGWLFERLHAFVATGSVLIFVATKKGTVIYCQECSTQHKTQKASEELAANLLKANFKGK